MHAGEIKGMGICSRFSTVFRFLYGESIRRTLEYQNKRHQYVYSLISIKKTLKIRSAIKTKELPKTGYCTTLRRIICLKRNMEQN